MPFHTDCAHRASMGVRTIVTCAPSGQLTLHPPAGRSPAGAILGEGGVWAGLRAAEAGLRGAARAQAAAGKRAAPDSCTPHHDGARPQMTTLMAG